MRGDAAAATRIVRGRSVETAGRPRISTTFRQDVRDHVHAAHKEKAPVPARPRARGRTRARAREASSRGPAAASGPSGTWGAADASLVRPGRPRHGGSSAGASRRCRGPSGVSRRPRTRRQVAAAPRTRGQVATAPGSPRRRGRPTRRRLGRPVAAAAPRMFRSSWRHRGPAGTSRRRREDPRARRGGVGVFTTSRAAPDDPRPHLGSSAGAPQRHRGPAIHASGSSAEKRATRPRHAWKSRQSSRLRSRSPAASSAGPRWTIQTQRTNSETSVGFQPLIVPSTYHRRTCDRARRDGNRLELSARRRPSSMIIFAALGPSSPSRGRSEAEISARASRFVRMERRRELRVPDHGQRRPRADVDAADRHGPVDGLDPRACVRRSGDTRMPPAPSGAGRGGAAGCDVDRPRGWIVRAPSWHDGAASREVAAAPRVAAAPSGAGRGAAAGCDVDRPSVPIRPGFDRGDGRGTARSTRAEDARRRAGRAPVPISDSSLLHSSSGTSLPLMLIRKPIVPALCWGSLFFCALAVLFLCVILNALSDGAAASFAVFGVARAGTRPLPSDDKRDQPLLSCRSRTPALRRLASALNARCRCAN